MFSSTGSLSLLLGMLVLIISLAGIFSVYSVIKNRSLEAANIDKLIELGKWFIVSVAITLSVSVVNDGFREREQDMKEMELFDKYTPIILEADGVEKRRLLCEYFASVSPAGAIRNSWKEYKTVVEGHVSEKMKAETKALEIANKGASASETEVGEKIQLVEKATALNQSLVASLNQADLKPRIYFHIRDENQRSRAKRLAEEMEESANVVVPGVQRVDVGPSVNELRYFRRAEEQEAKQIANSLSSLGLQVAAKYVEGFEGSTNIRPRHYELWISRDGL
jgi:hypothetical protein